MFERPSFKPQFRVEVVSGEGVVLLSETAKHVLVGSCYDLVAPCLDGRRGVDAIVAALAGRADPSEVRRVLAELEARGFLAEGGDDTPVPEAAQWAALGVDPRVARRRLETSGVSVIALGDLAVEPLVGALRSVRVRVGADEPRGVVLTDDYLHSGLAARNREALATGRPWLLVKPVGAEIWIGPVFQPGRTGCWECLARRLRGNRSIESFLAARRAGAAGPAAPVRASTAATQQVGWNLAASSIAAWIARDEAGALDGAMLTLDTRSWRTTTHVLTWLPQCAACGDPFDEAEEALRPVVLESRRKTFTQDGGHRVRTPEATLERYERHVSPITGAVSRLERTGRSGLIHGYTAGENLALRVRSLSALGPGLRRHSGGKGATDAQARASALCEALERYSGVYQGTEPRRQARMKELGDAAIHPNACMGFSERQYRDRDAWNARCSYKHAVPVPFDEERSIDWTPVWSLTRREPRFLPTSLCFYHYPIPSEEAACVACSNGNAAGNTLEEAILQGFLELVERDGAALWWYNRLRRPLVALDTFDEPYLGAVRAYLRERDRDLWVLDLTSDLGIPTAVAVSRRCGPGPEQIMVGFGSHLDPRIAVLRAVTELNQFLLPFLSAERGAADHTGAEGLALREWLAEATLAAHPYLAPDLSQAARTASEYPAQWSDDLRDDVRFCQATVERHGLEMLVLDQTRPDIGLPVVKVFVPGLRHFWPRFGPGRLYEAPARLGWLSRALVEKELNPVALFV